MIQLTDSVMAEILPSRQLSWLPRWSMGGHKLFMGPYSSAEEYDHHLGKTIGSSDWLGLSDSDEIRFDEQERILQSLLLPVPPLDIASDTWLESWHMVDQREGLLRLKIPQNFKIFITDTGYLSSDGTKLICIQNNFHIANAHQRWRLRVGLDFDLLIVNGILGGWILHNPLHHLTLGWEDLSTIAPDDAHHYIDIAHTYLALISPASMLRLEDGDTRVLAQLRDLRAEVEVLASSFQRHIMLKTLDDNLDTLEWLGE